MNETVKTLCGTCWERVDAPVKTFTRTHEKDGIAFTCEEAWPVCPKCGEKIGAGLFWDRNMKAYQKKLREISHDARKE